MYQLAIPASKRFKLTVGEGVEKPLEILYSKEISGPRPGFAHPTQRTISVYVRKAAQGWYVGYVHDGGSGASLGSWQLDWLEKLDDLGTSWNAPPDVQREFETYSADDAIHLLDVDENGLRVGQMFGKTRAKIENPRKFAIWLDPIDTERN